MKNPAKIHSSILCILVADAMVPYFSPTPGESRQSVLNAITLVEGSCRPSGP